MKHDNTPIINVLAILRRLQTCKCHKVSVNSVEKSLGVNRRTVYRYADSLSKAGYDVTLKDGVLTYKESDEVAPRFTWKEITLTPEQRMYFETNFPFCDNTDLMKQMGLEFSTYHRMARDLGLKKDPVYEKWMRKRAGKRAAATNKKRGNNPPKGYIIPGSENYRFKKGESLKGRVSEERWREIKAKANSTRNETLRRDKLRRSYGLSPLTKFKNLGNKMPTKVRSWRLNARKRGYILEDKVARYDENTRRSDKFEANGRNHGFTIIPVGAEVITQRVTARTEGMKGISFE